MDAWSASLLGFRRVPTHGAYWILKLSTTIFEALTSPESDRMLPETGAYMHGCQRLASQAVSSSRNLPLPRGLGLDRDRLHRPRVLPTSASATCCESDPLGIPDFNGVTQGCVCCERLIRLA